MAQFDVYRNPHEATRDLFPYILDITHALHSDSKLRVMVPLCNDRSAIKHLNPEVVIEGERLYLSVMDIAGIPASLCTNPVTSLSDRRTEIIDAMDFLVNGF